MRLIDAEKLCLYLADIQLANRGWKDDYCEVLDDIISIIDEQTTIEAEPVRHGRWEKCSQYDIFDYCQCSECGYFSFDGDTNYCPYCGTKMDGEDENEDGVD